MHWLASCEVMNLELRQLEAFAATARTGSFTAAARELGIGQPAVSQLVRRLENELGVVLFQRTGRSVSPSGAAGVLLPSAQAALDAFGAAQRTAEGLAGGIVGTLRLVTTPGSLGLLQGLLDEFAAAWPHVRLDLVPRPRQGRRAGLRRSEIDFALVRSTPAARGISYASVHREPWSVVLSSMHPLATTGRPLDVVALGRWPFVGLAVHGTSPAEAAYRAAQPASVSAPLFAPAVTATDDLFATLLSGRSWTLLTAGNVSGLIDGLTALAAPESIGPAELWLAHRTRPAPLEQALLTLATRRRDRSAFGPTAPDSSLPDPAPLVSASRAPATPVSSLAECRS